MERKGQRLTRFSFKPYRYGVYSEKIRKILDSKDDIKMKQDKEFEELSEIVVSLTKYMRDED